MSERGVLLMVLCGPTALGWFGITLFDPFADAQLELVASYAAPALTAGFVAGCVCALLPTLCRQDRLCIDLAARTITWNGRVYQRGQIKVGPVVPDRHTGRRFDVEFSSDEGTQTARLIRSEWLEFQAIYRNLAALADEPDRP